MPQHESVHLVTTEAITDLNIDEYLVVLTPLYGSMTTYSKLPNWVKVYTRAELPQIEFVVCQKTMYVY